MSTPEVEPVLAWHEALNAGDAERVASFSHPEVEVGEPRGSARGRRVLKDWVARANVRLTPLRLFRRDQTVVVEETTTWRDALSGETVGEATVVPAFELDGGLVTGSSGTTGWRTRFGARAPTGQTKFGQSRFEGGVSCKRARIWARSGMWSRAPKGARSVSGWATPGST